MCLLITRILNIMKERRLLFVLILLAVMQCPVNAQLKDEIDYSKDGIQMVFVKGGTFVMGSTEEQQNNNESDEIPIHNVTLSDYYISKYEITVAQFKKFISATNYKTDADKSCGSYIVIDNNIELSDLVNWRCDENGFWINYINGMTIPVVHISWNDAVAYCKWLSQTTGKHYRIPTEAEWEYAARGGRFSHKYEFSGSNNIDEVAWYSNNSGGKMHRIGQKKANELGIYDMSGNVWEWCSDIYGPYTIYPQMNPTGASIGYYRVVRGGSWYRKNVFARVSNRNCNGTETHSSFSGFRIVMVP